MPTLDQIAETGIFSKGLDGSLQRQFIPFNEELTAELFAEEINSGRMDVKDAYIYFWSYEEDKELWDLPKRNMRSLLPAWENMLSYLSDMLEDSKLRTIMDTLTKSYLEMDKIIEARYTRETTSFSYKNEKGESVFLGIYNPFEEDFRFIAHIVSHKQGQKRRLTRGLLDILQRALEAKDEDRICEVLMRMNELQYYPRIMWEMGRQDSKYSYKVQSCAAAILIAHANPIGADDPFLKYIAKLFSDEEYVKSKKIKNILDAKEEYLQKIREIRNTLNFIPAKEELGDFVREVHNILKPQGYNPTVKEILT